jgi:cytoskeletal protein CcmA (bactofilin family)
MENQIAVPRKETGFSMVTQESLGRKISINPREERITTVFSESSRMKGDFLLKDGIKIDGSIEGSVIFGTDDGMCIVSKTGVVDGSIAGPRAFILGTVQGDIAIEGVLLLAPSAVVMGNVSYGRLIVLDGAQVSGQFNMNTRKQHLANTSFAR